MPTSRLLSDHVANPVDNVTNRKLFHRLSGLNGQNFCKKLAEARDSAAYCNQLRERPGVTHTEQCGEGGFQVMCVAGTGETKFGGACSGDPSNHIA